MLLAPQIIVNLVVDTLFVFLATIAFFISIDILLHYDKNSSNEKRFILQKRSYLSSTIVAYIFMIKIPLFLYFIYTLDSITIFLKGAMCAVGVIEASPYGIFLMIIKIIALYLFGFWLIMHKKDMQDRYNSLLYLKSLYYLIVYGVLVVEIVLEYLYFFDIQPNSLVDCCGVVFSPNKTTIIATLLSQPNSILYGSFYVVYGVLVLSYLFSKELLYAIASIVFIPVALLSLIGYFGTYIYQLPTHHCPFCLMQKDYYYVGYFLYSFLFLGTFYGIVGGITKLSLAERRFSMIMITLYSGLVTFYPLWFYIQNGVWLY